MIKSKQNTISKNFKIPRHKPFKILRNISRNAPISLFTSGKKKSRIEQEDSLRKNSFNINPQNLPTIQAANRRKISPSKDQEDLSDSHLTKAISDYSQEESFEFKGIEDQINIISKDGQFDHFSLGCLNIANKIKANKAMLSSPKRKNNQKKKAIHFGAQNKFRFTLPNDFLRDVTNYEDEEKENGFVRNYIEEEYCESSSDIMETVRKSSKEFYLPNPNHDKIINYQDFIENIDEFI